MLYVRGILVIVLENGGANRIHIQDQVFVNFTLRKYPWENVFIQLFYLLMNKYKLKDLLYLFFCQFQICQIWSRVCFLAERKLKFLFGA